MARRAPIRRPGSKARKVVAVGVLAVLCLIPILSVFVQRVSASTQGGILDTTWPTSVSGFNLTAILVAPDGKIWTAHAQGTNAYTTTGSISVATKWEGSVPSSLATQVTDAGTYVLAGTSAGIYRYLASTGAKDTTFGTGQSGINRALLVYGSGASQKIFAAASNDLKRYSASGALESTISLGSAANALEQQTYSGTDYVLVGGAFGIKRYTTGGVLDSTFTANPGGTVTAIKMQSDGKILVAGTFGLKRYNADGSSDSTLGSITTSLLSLAVQSDGKIVAGTSSALLRYSSVGVAETTFNSNAALNGSFDSRALALESSGSIIVGGTSNVTTKKYLRRYSWENVAPGAPLTPTATPSDRSAIVTVAKGSGVTPTSYAVYVVGDLSKTCTVTGASGSCTVSGLVNGTSYQFYAVAYNVDAVSPNSPDSAAVVPADTVRPAISTATLDSAGTTIALTYNEALGSTTALTGAFTVSAGGTNFPVTSVSVSGSTVSLGLSAVIGQGLTVTVSYTAPTSDTSTSNTAIQDLVGNDALSLTNQSSTNGSLIDTTRPTYVSSNLNTTGTVLTLVYNEALNATTAPASAFTVTANSAPVAVSSVTVSGSSVQLTLASTVGASPVTVAVAYTAPTSDGTTANSAIQDLVGNDAVSLTSRTITTNSSTVDLTAPTISTTGTPRAINTAGTVLTLTYNESLNATTAPASAFTVMVAGVERAVSSVAINGTKVELTLASPAGSGQTVTVSYTAPAVDATTANSAVQDLVGNDAASITGQSVSNSSTIDLTPPTVSSRAINTAGTVLTITYNETLNATTAPASAFTVMVNDVERAVTGVAINGTKVELTLASAVERLQTVTVAYTAPTASSATSNNAVQDTVGNDAVSFTATSVTNSSSLDLTPPTFVSGAVSAAGTLLTLTYNETLHATTAATTAFTVMVDGVERSVTGVSVSTTQVRLTLASAVIGGASVTVAYTAPAINSTTANSAIQDSVGNDAVSLATTAVTNGSTDGPPVLSSVEVLSNGSQVRVNWNETLGSNYPPLSTFTVMVNGAQVSATGMNTATPSNYFVLNLSSTVKAGQTVTISYAAPTPDSTTANQAVQDTGGLDAASVTDYVVTNNSTVPADITAPTLSSASVSTAGTVLTLAYNETLSASTAPSSAFVVKVNGIVYSVSSAVVSGSNVQITIAPAAQAGETVTVSYTAPTPDGWATNSAIQDTSGNDAISLTDRAVTNNSTAGPDIAPPTLNTVTSSGTSLVLSFNEPLASALPPLSAFTVFVGSTAVVPTAVTISGSSVVLTLPSSVTPGTEVQVSYVAPTASSSTTNLAIQDLAGNDALSFNGTTQPHSTIWEWRTPFDPATNTTISSRCPGGGSINREKYTTLPNGVEYSVVVEGDMTCIHDATESLAARGGQEGMFVATGLVTEPGLKLTTTNDDCLADVVCNNRGFVTLKFSQPVTNPVFSFAGWGGSASGRSWTELKVLTAGVTLTKLSGTNIAITQDGTYIEDNGQASSTRCSTDTAGSSAVCGSVQINGTVSLVRFEVFMQTSGGTGNEDTWNLTASMAEDFGLVPTTYEAAGVASHGVVALKLGPTVAADNVSSLYSTTNGDAVSRWTSLDNHPKEDDGVATWKDSPTVVFVAGDPYSVTVALGGVTQTAYLCAWIDFNRDETFAYGERACSAPLAIGATSATLTWTVPAGAVSGLTYARVRISHEEITLPTGKLGSGEVEDYSLVISSDALPTAVNDVSTNGQGVTQTLSPLTNDLFETSYPANTSTLRLCGSLESPSACTQTTLTVTGEGTYTVNTTTGVVTFVPLPNFTGTATSVRYQITDTQATPETASALITVTVYPRPTAAPDSTSGLLDAEQSKNPLLNDSYGDSRVPLDATSVRLCGTSPAQTPPNCNQTTVSVVGGMYSVSTATGVITFTPTTGFVGTAPAVTYQVKDSINQVASSTYTPTTIASASGVDDGSTGAWNVDQVIVPLGNDTTPTGYPLGLLKLCGRSPVETAPNCSQPELTVAGEGTYTVNANGSVTFNPLPTFTGVATPIDYQAQNSLGQVVDATITVEVLPPPPPDADPDTSQNLVNVVQSVNVLGNDTTFDPAITLDATTVRLCGTSPVQTPPSCNQTTVSVTGGVYSVDTTTGVVTFTPTTNFSGTPTPVTYQVTDSTRQTASSTYSPLVIARPVATNDASTGNWNVNQTISPIASDTPAAGHPLGTLKLCDPSSAPPESSPNCTLTALTVSGVGTYTVNAGGTVTFDPLPTFTGAASVPYQVVDDLGQYASAVLTYTVTPPPAPVAKDDISTGLLNVNQTINPLANDDTSNPLIGLDETSVRLCATTPTPQTAPNCTATSVTVVGGTYSVDLLTGLITFDPDNNFSGEAPSVDYQVTDTTSQVASATYTPTVYPRPAGIADVSSGAWDTNQLISPLTGDTFTPSNPALLSSLRLCDPSTTPAQTSPNCTLTSLTIAGQGTYTVNTTTGVVTFDPIRTFTGTATPVSYQATDTLGQYVTSTITATVNAPPAPTASDETKSTLQGQPVAFTTITGTSGLASGVELQTSGANVTCLFTPGTTTCDADNVVAIAGAGTYTLNAATGVVTFAPAIGALDGSQPSITYRVTDAIGQTATGQLTPVLAPAPDADDDTSIGNWNTPQVISVLTNDDPGAPSAPLVASSVKLCNPSTSPPQTAPNCTLTSLTIAGQGTYTVNGDGTVTFIPLSTFSGVATSVTYQVSDSLGQAASAIITVTVRTPPDAVNDTSSGLYDVNQAISPLGNDVNGSGTLSAASIKLCDAGTTAPNCSLTSLTVAGEGTYAVNNTTGVVTFNPLPTFTGVATPVAYQVNDEFGQTTSATITPTVGTPPAPSASPNTSSGSYDTNQTITPLANDAGGNSSFPLDATTVKLCAAGETSPNCNRTSLTVAGEGTYTVNTTTGVVTFDPLPTFSGTATPITYQVEDSLDRVVSSTITVTVVAPALTMVNDTSTGAYDTNQTITPLTNDVPGGGVTGAEWRVATVKLCNPSTSPPQTSPNCTLASLTIADQGTYTVNPDGTVTFNPLPSFTGVATAITYQATDVLNRTTSATITVTVLAPPPPLANPDTASLIAGGTETFSNIFGTDGLARKQTGGPELVPATVCIIDPATNVCDTDNQVVIADQGTFTLDPATGIVTYQSLSTATSGAKTAVLYSITDTLGVSATATLTPTIYPKPTALPDSSVGVMGVVQTLSPFGNDSPGTASHPLVRNSIKLCGDTETSPNCTQTSVTVDGEGTYTVMADGTVQFAPISTFVGAATSLAYTVTDSLGQKATSTLRPRVVPPPAPITQVDTGTAVVGSTVVLSPWVNDSPGAVPAGVEGEVELVPTSIRLCSPTDAAPSCTLTTLTTDDGTYTVDITTGRVTFVHRADFLGTVTQPVTYIIKNDWTGESGIGVATGLLIPTIVEPPPPAPIVTVEIPPPSATDDSITSKWNTAQTYTPTTNDTFPTSQADHATLRLCAGGESPNICSFTTVTVPNEGTYTVNADGTVTFTPVASFFGTATPLTYQVTDALGRFVHANLIPIVLPPEVGARVFDQATSTKPRTAQWLEPTQRGIPSPGAVFVDSTLQLYDTTAAAWVKKVVTPDGTWRVKGGQVKFTPVDGFTGMTQLQYNVSDSNGILLSAYLTVVVDEKEAMPATGSSPLPLAALALALVALGCGVSLFSRARRLRL